MLTLRIDNHSCQLGGGKKLIAFLAFLLSAPQAILAYDFSQDGLYYDILSTEDKTCEVSDCSYNLSTVVIPSTVVYNGTTYSVTSIGDEAFYGYSNLTSVEIPNSVTSIGKEAFYSCSRLTSVEIPNSVTSIGICAFGSCSGLTSIEIPNSVTSIGSSAFAECSSLTTVEIPNSVTSIEEEAFSGCSNLNGLIIKDGEDTLTIQSNTFNDCPIHTLYFGRDVNDYINFKSLKTLIIGNLITSIGAKTFYYCSNLTSVEIGNSVTSIGDYAFYGCSSLTSVEIPNSVTSIGDVAFYGCNRLHSVTIGAGVLYIGGSAFSRSGKVIWLCNTPPEGYTNVRGSSVNYTVNTLYEYLPNVNVYPYLSLLFEVGNIKYVPTSPSERTCEAIDCSYDTTSVVRIGRTVNYQGIEMTVEDIRPNVCYDNDHLKALHLDGYVGVIGHRAFYGCDSLASVVIPNTVTSLGASCFAGCTALAQADINVNGDLGSSCFEGCSALTQAILGDSIAEISGSCFKDCSALTEITVPAAVKRIGNNVFEGCTSLANVTIADRDSVLTLGFNDFYSSNEPMFADCPLQTVYIGGNISYTTYASNGYSPFYRNTSLKSVTITDKETEISENEFYGCTNLKNVTLGDGIETIGSYAFSGCAALTDFTFGSSLNTIGAEAFSDCTAMTRLVSRTAEPPVCGPQALDDINKWTCKLYVPDASIDAYQSADQWKEFFFITDIAHATEDSGSSADRILSGRVQVFDLSGRQLKEARNANSIDEVLNGLPSGTYILRGSGAAMKVIHE